MPRCVRALIGYQPSIGDTDETPEQEVRDAEREVDQELGELEREAEDMEDRLAEQADDDDTAAEVPESGVDAPKDSDESAESASE